MSTVKEIKAAIAALPTSERAKLESWLFEHTQPVTKPVALPDQASRRRDLYGKSILPNMVLLERESKSL